MGQVVDLHTRQTKLARAERLAERASTVKPWQGLFIDIVIGPTECYVWGEDMESGKGSVLLDTKGDLDALEIAIVALAQWKTP